MNLLRNVVAALKLQLFQKVLDRPTFVSATLMTLLTAALLCYCIYRFHSVLPLWFFLAVFLPIFLASLLLCFASQFLIIIQRFRDAGKPLWLACMLTVMIPILFFYLAFAVPDWLVHLGYRQLNIDALSQSLCVLGLVPVTVVCLLFKSAQDGIVSQKLERFGLFKLLSCNLVGSLVFLFVTAALNSFGLGSVLIGRGGYEFPKSGSSNLSSGRTLLYCNNFKGVRTSELEVGQGLGLMLDGFDKTSFAFKAMSDGSIDIVSTSARETLSYQNDRISVFFDREIEQNKVVGSDAAYFDAIKTSKPDTFSISTYSNLQGSSSIQVSTGDRFIFTKLNDHSAYQVLLVRVAVNKKDSMWGALQNLKLDRARVSLMIGDCQLVI